jgi:hypothetical protein
LRHRLSSITEAILICLSVVPIAWAQSPSKPAAASEVIAKVESCPLEPTQVAKLAARRGYQFLATTAIGEGTCSIDEATLILVVSATSHADAMCNFELFAPPQQRRLGILRIGVKAGPGTATRYFQRGEDANRGLRFVLPAQKNETRQFRVVAIDAEPIANACPEATINGAIP